MEWAACRRRGANSRVSGNNQGDGTEARDRSISRVLAEAPIVGEKFKEVGRCLGECRETYAQTCGAHSLLEACTDNAIKLAKELGQLKKEAGKMGFALLSTTAADDLVAMDNGTARASQGSGHRAIRRWQQKFTLEPRDPSTSGSRVCCRRPANLPD